MKLNKSLSIFLTVLISLSFTSIADAKGKGSKKAHRGSIGVPFSRIQNTLDDLQTQIDTIQLTPGPQGEQGPAGNIGSSGLDGVDGAQGPAGNIGSSGSDGVDGAQGPAGNIGSSGLDGVDGTSGIDGLHCWDLNGDGVGQANEDINADGLFNTADCQGSTDISALVAEIQYLKDRLNSSDLDFDGFSPATGDCNDANSTVYPGAPEIADGLDNNCDNIIDDTLAVDADADGYFSINTGGTDCDDFDDTVNPGAVELLDGIDNNCNGDVDEGLIIDLDGDGFSSTEDCDDTDPSINPDAIEVFDGLDNNCNGLVDEGTGIDADNDGFFSASTGGNDCDDTNASINPGAIEVFDGVDNNCNGLVDEGIGIDADNDGFFSASTGGNDCDDTNFLVRPNQQQFFSNPAGGGSFDYDCNGIEERQDTSHASYNDPGFFQFTCEVSQAGWYSGIPACGQTARYLDSGNTNVGQSGACIDITYFKAQVCK